MTGAKVTEIFFVNATLWTFVLWSRRYYTTKIIRRAQCIKLDSLCLETKRAGLCYAASFLWLLFWSSLIGAALFKNPRLWHPSEDELIFEGLLYLFIVIFPATWMFYVSYKSSLVMDHEALRHFNGMRMKIVHLAEIRSVHARNGYIVIDTGVIPRTLVPLEFQKSDRMLAILDQRARQNKNKQVIEETEKFWRSQDVAAEGPFPRP